MKRLIPFAVILALPSGAIACAANTETLLSCSFEAGAKTLNVCLAEGNPTYEFGQTGASPDLSLAPDLLDVDYRPWPGVGRALFEELTFYNAGYSYMVYSIFDRLDENAVMEGGIIVSQGNTELAQLECDPGSGTAGIDRLFNAMQSRGQCWDHAQHLWGPCP